MSTGSTAVEVLDLTRDFDGLTAVKGLTFSVERGELFGLVGPDGAGKTTTLRMLAGVLRPTAGDARVGGISVTRDPEAVKSGIAYMPQRFGLYTDLTVMENLTFYADLYRVSKRERPARLQRLFEFSDLEPFKDRLAGALSGGMKQKLGLSCALIHQPDVLLLDEPTFGVDPISRRDLWLIVHEMVAQGVTVVVSTAYMDEAERFDRLALLYRGRMLAIDTPDALRSAMKGTILELRVDDVRAVRDTLSGLGGVRRAAIFGDRVHVIVDPEDRGRASIESALAASGIEVQGLRRIPPSMEDVFIDRIGSEVAS